MTDALAAHLQAKRPSISAVLVVCNEANNLPRCLASLHWVDEVLVVDTGSTDATIEIARTHGCRVITTPWKGFGATKGFAVTAAAHDWILSLDADEVVGDRLRDRLIRLLEEGPQHQGYRPRFRTSYLGREIRHCGWDNEYHLRVFNRRHGNYAEMHLHESVVLDGSVLQLEEEVLHNPYPTIEAHLNKVCLYSGLGALQLRQQGRHASLPEAFARAVLKFVKMYLFQAGFLDGAHGLILSGISSYAVLCKYLRLWELTRCKPSS
ncbi:MAG: glycosyltransferase family 2 protein [Candidatus Eisenbacteria bacterium]